MSKALVTKMKAEAVGHELKAAEMLRCAKRLLDLAERRTKIAAGLRRATAVLVGGKRGRGRPRKVDMKSRSYTYNALVPANGNLRHDD